VKNGSMASMASSAWHQNIGIVGNRKGNNGVAAKRKYHLCVIMTLKSEEIAAASAGGMAK